MLALELAARVITMNLLVPRPIEGASISIGIKDDDPYKSLLASVPIRRLARPQDVADLDEFLASEKVSVRNRR